MSVTYSYYLVDKFAAIPTKEQKLQTADSKEWNKRYLLKNAVVVNILQNKTVTLQELCKIKKNGEVMSIGWALRSFQLRICFRRIIQ